MIAPFTPAAGVAGGLGPAVTPGAVSVPGADGFDALLGQLSAALLATVADAAPGVHLPHAEATSDHDGHVDPDTTAVDVTALLAAGPLLPPVATLPAFETSSPVPGESLTDGVDPSVPAGVHLPSHGASAATGSWTVAQSVSEAAAHAVEIASHANEAVDDAAAPAMPWATPRGDAADPSSMAAPGPEPEVSVSPADAVPIESFASNRRIGPLPFEQSAHERSIGRRSLDMTIETTSSPAPVSASIVPATSTVDTVATERAGHTVQLGAGTPRELASLDGQRRPTAGLSDLPRRGARFVGPYERVAAHAMEGRTAIPPDPTTWGSVPESLTVDAAPVGVKVPVGSTDPAVVDSTTPDQSALPATSWPPPAARARALGRALDAHTDRLPDSAAPAELVAQVAQVARGVATSGIPTDADTAVGDVLNRRAGRVGTSAAARPTPGVPIGAGVTSEPHAAEGDGLTSAAAPISPTWRATLASFDRAGDTPVASAPSAPTVPALGPFITILRPPVDDVPVAVDAMAVEAPTLDAATGESVHAQIVRSLKVQWTGGLSEARVTLRPEFLGEVVATITVEQGVVSATLQADTPEVRHWIEAHTSSLRDALVEHGLKLDRLTVAEPAREPADADRQGRPRGRQPEAPPSRRRRAPDAHDSQFELTA